MVREDGYGVEPSDWTREVAAAYVAAVDRSTIGQWSTGAPRTGQPLKPVSKASNLTAVRQFFRDCQEWGWIPIRFNPYQALATRRSVRCLIGPDLMWLFAGLRCSEIVRLRVGCIRWDSGENASSEPPICFLHVPVNKTGTAFSKPIDGVVRCAVQLWEQMRPPQPSSLDLNTGEQVHQLFSHRGRGCQASTSTRL